MSDLGFQRFVLLEDDDSDAESLKERLRRAGFQVRWQRARTEAEFRAALSAAPMSLILSDFSLPEHDGLAVLELAQELAPGVPLIFISGALGEERATETLRRGATDYVLKGRMERLPLAIHRALELSEERQRRLRAEAERDCSLQAERRARAEAEAANRMKDEFLATASHELRTPLNAILGWAKLLRASEPSAEMLERGLATIERNAIAQSRLIEDILDISRIVTGKVQLHVTRVSVASFVHAAVDALRPAAAAKHLTLSVQADDAGELDGDAERLQQVLWNLVSNAVKFTPAHGVVRVSAGRAAERVQIVVEDSGPGIAAAEVPRVFERFWQAEVGAARRQGGLGLGLSIVRYLVELHGGSVRAESAGLGRGARFSVELPAGAEELADPSAPRGAPSEYPPAVQAEPSALLGLHALVVDDDEDTRELLALILRSSGAQVTAIGGAEEAVQAVQQRRFNVLVSDIGMPQVDGYALIRAVRRLPPEHGGHLPAIALSAYTREQDLRRAMDAGFQAHLPKPLVPAQLVSAIRRLCAASPADPRSAS